MAGKISGADKMNLVNNTLNTVANNSPYLSNAPKVENEETLQAFGKYILQNGDVLNEFTNLIARIFEVRIWNMVWENPLAFVFNDGDWGDSIEEIFVNTAKVFGYDPYGRGEEMWKRVPPDVRTMIHRMNAKFFAKGTIYDANLRKYFLSYDKFYDFFQAQITSLYNAINIALYQSIKYIIARALLSTSAAGVHIEAGANPNEYTKKLKEFTSNLGFLTDKYNAAGVDNYTPLDNLYLLVTPEFDATQSIDVLAYMFQIDQAQLPYKKIVIDSWTDWRWDYIQEVFIDGVEEFTQEEIVALKRLKAVLLDNRGIIAYDMYHSSEVARNKEKLYENYWIHMFATLSFSPFANMIAFVEGDAGAELSAWKNPYGALKIQAGRDNRFYARPAIAHGLFTEQVNVFPEVDGDALIPSPSHPHWYTVSEKRGATATLTYNKPANAREDMENLVIQFEVI